MTRKHADAEAEVTELEARRQTMITYLRMKTQEQDYHGVADAAMDLREIDAQLQLLARLATVEE